MTAAERLVVDTLALSEHDLQRAYQERSRELVEALRDAEAYRLMALDALRLLHEAGRREASLREQATALREEIRRYTAKQTIGQAA